MRVQALLVAALLLGIASVSAQDANKKTLEQMQGEWQVEKGVKEGQPAPGNEIDGMRMVIDGNKISMKMPNREGGEQATFTLDTTKKPTTIDLAPPGKNEMLPGIVQLEGDTMQMAFARPGNDRPMEFASPAGSKIMYLQLRRAKK